MTFPEKEEEYDVQAVKELAAYLGFEKVISHEMYGRGIYGIFNDTIAGFHFLPWKQNEPKRHLNLYHFRSLSDTSFKKNFSHSFQIFKPESQIFNEGYAYMIGTSARPVIRIGINGSARSYFSAYEREIFNPTKLLLYNDLVILKAFNGIFIFEKEKEQLIWKYNYHVPTNTGYHAIVGNSLIFVDGRYPSSNPKLKYVVKGDSVYTRSTMIYCLDLERMEENWSIVIENKETGFGDFPLPTNNTNMVGVLIEDTTWFLDTRSGDVINRLPVKSGRADIPIYGDTIYAYREDKLVCMDVRKDSLIWEAENRGIWFMHKDLIIDYRDNQFHIVDRTNGRLIHTIPVHNKIKAVKVQHGYFHMDSLIFSL